MALHIDLTNSESDSLTLLIKGELDLLSLKQDYFAALTSGDEKHLSKAKSLKVDLSKVDRADTAGLAWLLNLAKDANKRKLKVEFDNVPAKLLNLADLSNAREFMQG